MSDDQRSSLARAQAELARALAAQGAVPPEFDPARIALASKMLVEKRARAVSRAWPKLAESLGSKFTDDFTATSPYERSPGPSTS